MTKFSLPRTKQCAKCPWKVTTNPNYIPDGYNVEKHKALSCTITKDPLSTIYKPTNNMACHHSTGQDDMYCVGWINNQLGVGNNIGLRIRMMGCDNLQDLKLVGEQHEKFEYTLPI